MTAHTEMIWVIRGSKLASGDARTCNWLMISEDFGAVGGAGLIRAWL